MQDFNSFVNNNGDNGQNESLFKKVSNIAKKFDGKSQDELYRAVIEEAKKGKQKGTLSNSDLDNFANMLSPVLDAEKKKTMLKIIDELKKI